MRHSGRRFAVIFAIFAMLLVACKPSEPPPDLLKTQRDVMDKSKAVQGQLQQQAEEQKKVLDNAEK